MRFVYELDLLLIICWGKAMAQMQLLVNVQRNIESMSYTKLMSMVMFLVTQNTFLYGKSHLKEVLLLEVKNNILYRGENETGLLFVDLYHVSMKDLFISGRSKNVTADVIILTF